MAFIHCLMLGLAIPLISALSVIHDPADIDVSEICKNITCIMGKICRVVRHCGRPQCHPEFACIRCVPDGADKQCNDMGYTHAVLHGYPDKIRSTLTALECNFSKSCPFGSTCVTHPVFKDRGVCCYGGPGPKPATNDEKKCRVCDPRCKEGFACEQVKNECGEFVDECMPIAKYGNCPPATASIFYASNLQSCEHDQQCYSIKKCCKNRFNQSFCVYPTREV